MIDIPYARAADIFTQQLDLLLPSVKISVSQHAAKHRELRNPGGGYSGRWQHDMAPYLVEPMDCLYGLDHLTVAVAAPGQCGKTSIAENWMLWSVDTSPADLLWYMQTDDSLEAYVKGQIKPMVDLHPQLSGRIGRRPSDDSIHFKQFRGMRVEFLAATHANLINKRAPRLVADEIDAYLASLGDVKALLDVRRQTYGRQSKLLALSHPDRAKGLNPKRDWTDGIMAIYADSDMRVWYWPCPYCGAWSSPVPIASRHMPIWYPEDAPLDVIEREARLMCPVNDCLIEDSFRREMNRYGRWIGIGQEISEDGIVTGERIRHLTAGFWIVGAMSPFVLGGLGGLARARVKAERDMEVSGEDKTLRQVMVKQWGIPLSPSKAAGSVDANELADRAELDLKIGVVPLGARFLTVAVDVQKKYFEFMVRAWGVRGESWVIDQGTLVANPDTSAEDWDRLLAEVLEKTYPLADGSRRHMRIRGAGYDLSGEPGVSQQAYSAWTRWKRKQKIRFHGQAAGRDVYSILPTKGASAVQAQRLVVTYPDTSRKSNVRSAKGSVPVAIFNPNHFKDDLAGQLKVAEAGPLYVHFPAAFKSKEPPHMWFEQVVSEQLGRDGRWTKIRQNDRNENLDLLVMTHVVAHLHGLARIPWDKPPPWAAEWDRNSMIISAPESSAPQTEQRFAGETQPAPTAPAAAQPPAASPPAKRSLAERLA